MSQPTSASSVCAILVTFNPQPDLVHNVSLLALQVGAILIVDNASSEQTARTLEELPDHLPCTILRNQTNLGIAGALNIGFRVAIERNYEWIVTFDQDSTVTEGFIHALLDTALSSTDIGIVCPVYRDRNTGTIVALPKTPGGDLLTTMTSGSMLHRSTFQRAGYFNEKLYIDSVDIEYALRIRSLGLRLVQADGAVLIHSLGQLTLHRFMGKTLATTNHSAARRYYMARNRLFILSHYPREVSWIRRDVRQSFRDFIVMLLVEDHKVAKTGLMIKGCIDFLLGRWGPRVPL